MGSYEGSFTAEWKILRKEITESMISVGTLLYTGNAQDAPITVKDGDKTLVKDTDYQLTIFTSGYSAQSYTSNVTGKGNYTGKIENIEWEIQPKKITEDMIVTRVYNGQEQLAALKDGDTMLERDKDYAVYGTVGVTNVGSYDVNFQGKGNYTGTLVHARWKIVPKEITEDMVSVGTLTYDGSKQAAPITIKMGDMTLVKDTDYTLSGDVNAIDANSYSVTITGKGNFSGTLENVAWKIAPATLTKDMLSMTDEYRYNAEARTPYITVRAGSTLLLLGRDYTLTGDVSKTDVGDYVIGIEGKGNYVGTIDDLEWRITPRIDLSKITIETTDVTYNQTSQKVPVVVKDNGRALTEGRDYVLSSTVYATNAGSSSVVVNGTGNYTGSMGARTWTILPKEITRAMFPEAMPEFDYTGERYYAPSPKDGDYTLVKDTDYELRGTVYASSAGKQSSIYTGKGNYTGEVKYYEWKINPKDISAAFVKVKGTYTYNGGEIKPEIEFYDFNDQLIDVPSSNYAITAASGFTNINAGSAKATVTLYDDANYASDEPWEVSFTILPKALTASMLTTERSYTYDGSTKSPIVSVKDGETPLIEDTDYTVNGDGVKTDADSYTASISGKGNYTGTLEDIAWSISPITLTDSMIDRSASDVTYDGDSHSPNLIIKRGDTPLIKDTDYTIDGNTPKTDVGSYTVSVSGKGNYTGTVENIAWRINANTPSKDDLIIGSSFTYDGTEKSPTLKLKVGEKTLNKGTDYILTGDAAKTDAGTYKATVTFIGNYSGSLDVDWEIERAAQTINLAGIDETNSLKGVYGGSYSIQPINAHGKVSYAVNTRSAVVSVDENGKLSFLRSGSTTVTVSAAGDTNYLPAERTISVEVSKAPLTISVLNKTAYIGGKAPDLSAPVPNKDYRIEGLMEGDTPDMTIELFYGTTPDMTQEGEYTIEISTRCENDDRYELISLKQGKLTVCEKPSYTITATAGAHGSITPSGAKIVKKGDKISFKITPDASYVVADLKIDGKRVRSATSYTFKDVSANHRIEVTFMPADGNPQTGVDVSAED